MSDKIKAGFRWMWEKALKPGALWLWNNLIKPGLIEARKAFVATCCERLQAYC